MFPIFKGSIFPSKQDNGSLLISERSNYSLK